MKRTQELRTAPAAPKLTPEKMQALLAPWLERRRAAYEAELAAYTAATNARAEKRRAERLAAALVVEPFFSIEDELDCIFLGCGAACNCCAYMRSD